MSMSIAYGLSPIALPTGGVTSLISYGWQCAQTLQTMTLKDETMESAICGIYRYGQQWDRGCVGNKGRKGMDMLSRERIDAIVHRYGRDILEHEHMEIAKRSMQHGDITTFEHSLRVARLSVRIADRLRLWNHVNLRALVRAALLHDYFLYDWHDADDGAHRLHGFRHPYTAERNARGDFEIDAIVSNSIRTHMFPLTPIPPKYLEGFIVNIADTLSAIQETFASRLPRKDERKPRP